MENIDDILFDRKVEVARGVHTNKVGSVTHCPICGCKKFVLVEGNTNRFMCGTAIKLKQDSSHPKVKGELVSKCKYNVFHFYRETDYDTTLYYDTGYLEKLGITITGSCNMATRHPLPIDTESQHIKLYEKNGHLNMTGGKLVGTAVYERKKDGIKKALEQYIQDYNDVKDGNIWSWLITDNHGHYVDKLLGFIGNGYEIAKEYMSEYGIYKEDYEVFWKNRQD